MGHHNFNYIAMLLAICLLTAGPMVEGKRTLGKSRTGSSSSSSSNSRRYSSATSKPSYSGSSSNSHADMAKLSYPNYNSQPNRPANAPATGGSSQPIGWNVPQKPGPPPAYSPSNPSGGARTNVHEAAPAYKPNNAPPPSYSAATHSGSVAGAGAGHSVGQGAGHAGTVYRPRANSTGGFGGGFHTPIQATNTHSVQSSYPKQPLPGGATYYPSSAGLPAGATYHPAGSFPAGATYHPAGSIPAGAHYYPSGGVPAGASYYPSGGMPVGASYYPANAMPAGATFLPAGSALPAGATFLSQPPQGSSGPGLGTGLIAGALGGAILGHVLTPTHRETIQQVPVGAGPAASSSDGERIIIINNGPPGSVTTSEVGSGTTVINTSGGAAVPSGAPGVPAPGVSAPASAPAAAPAAAPATAPAALAPVAPIANEAASTVPLAPMQEGDSSVPLAPMAAAPLAAAAVAGASDTSASTPPPGGLICVPVMVNTTDPANPEKMIEVQQIACYNAPAPPPSESAVATSEVAKPVQSDAMQMPGDSVPPATPRISTAMLPENSKIQAAASGSEFTSIANVFTSTLLAVVVAYCLH